MKTSFMEAAYLRYQQDLSGRLGKVQKASLFCFIIDIVLALAALDNNENAYAVLLGLSSLVLFYSVCMPLDKELPTWQSLIHDYGASDRTY